MEKRPRWLWCLFGILLFLLHFCAFCSWQLTQLGRDLSWHEVPLSNCYTTRSYCICITTCGPYGTQGCCIIQFLPHSLLQSSSFPSGAQAEALIFQQHLWDWRRFKSSLKKCGQKWWNNGQVGYNPRTKMLSQEKRLFAVSSLWRPLRQTFIKSSFFSLFFTLQPSFSHYCVAFVFSRKQRFAFVIVDFGQSFQIFV